MLLKRASRAKDSLTHGLVRCSKLNPRPLFNPFHATIFQNIYEWHCVPSIPVFKGSFPAFRHTIHEEQQFVKFADATRQIYCWDLLRPPVECNFASFTSKKFGKIFQEPLLCWRVVHVACKLGKVPCGATTHAILQGAFGTAIPSPALQLSTARYWIEVPIQ